MFELAFTQGTEVPLTLERLRTAGQMSDEHARSRLLSPANLAALQLRRGDLDEGVTLGTTVVDQAHGTTSIRVADDLKRIYLVTALPHIKNARGIPQLRTATYDLLRTL